MITDYSKLQVMISFPLCFASHGQVDQVKAEIVGLKEGVTTLLYVLDMVGSTRKCWLVVDRVEGQLIVTHGYWTHCHGDGRR